MRKQMEVNPHALPYDLSRFELRVLVLDELSATRVAPKALAASMCVLAERTSSHSELGRLVF